MPRKSSITRLDPRIKQAVDAAIRDGRATIDELVELIESMGGEASRSAVGRYKLRHEQAMKVFQASQEMAEVWSRKINEDPESDIARLASQVLGGVALNTANNMLGEGEPMPAGEVMFLAKALDHLARADKMTAERAERIRKAERERIADEVEEAATAQGMGPDQVDFWRRKVLGVA